MAVKPKSYREAYKELESLAKKLESDEVEIDHLSEMVERAKMLVKYCQDKLRTTDEALNSKEKD